jgi:hypothetical protein
VIQAQARNAYDRTRSLFSLGFKSANKQYAANSGVSAAKRQRRSVNQLAANNDMNQSSARAGNFTDVQRGNNIIARFRQGNAIGGNCVEMSWVALAYFREQSQHTPAHIVCITNPGDHVFLHVGPVPPTLSSSMPARVWNLCSSVPLHWDSYIVDPWAGVCCHTRTYRAEFENKMGKWDSRQKEIWSTSGWVRPDAEYVANNMLSGPLIWCPV